MERGRLRHRVLIEELTPQVDTSGNVIQDASTGAVLTAWESVAQVWAAIEPLSAREFIAAQATQSKVTARVTILYRAGMTSAMRLVQILRGGARGTVYNIEGVLADKDSGLDYLTMPCSTGVSVSGQ